MLSQILNKKLKIYHNFINNQECEELNTWILKNKNKSFFKDAGMKGNRITTRYSDEKEITYPQTAFEIKNKIICKLNLQNYKKTPYPYGMVASCAFNGDTCYEHLDPVWHKGYTTLHCNVKLSDSLEGDIIIENDVVKIEKKDLWVYEVSKINHGSNLVKGNIPRTIWVFGFCIKNDRL
jgi:hypothetical protein